MRAVVTGAAGFIGSWLCEALVDDGAQVVAIDCFTSAYDPAVKVANLARLREAHRFEFIQDDLRTASIAPFLDGADVAFHLAAIPGVRASWDDGFRAYVEHNILGTQRVLEAARATNLPRLVYASSSSVYGTAQHYPTREDAVKRPQSPYGVSKLSAEHLCETYGDVLGVHTVILRYFSVYGPRQRPDMGVHRLIEAALGRGTFTRFGTGEQVRDMTYVEDVVQATLAASVADVPTATILNIAGGSEASLNELIAMVQHISGNEIALRIGDAQSGDVDRTGGDTTAAQELLDWIPATDLETGIRQQVRWHMTMRSRTPDTSTG